MPEPRRLREYIDAVTALVERGGDEATLLRDVREAKRRLVAVDDWLPPEMAVPHPRYFIQYRLYCDPRERFSVVSVVWGPGHASPVHDHTVWGVIGQLRGSEVCEPFRREGGAVVPAGPAHRMQPGDTDLVSPAIGDLHRVGNAFDDRTSISIHTYGADIGRVLRHVFDLETGAVKEFVSGYANA
ncbi:MAG: cysteine dioxygenase [Betaproteobacteria bacterium]